ncbi:MAG: molybdate ABC transporter permease subunit [Tissierellia bacterium]|nr:molybdate ABC transporter permease subunit [Tissierellia bacterium]
MNISEPILLSLKVASISTFITLLLGVGLSYLFTKHNFKLKDALESIIILPMVLPPSVLGYMLLKFFGKKGPMGIFIENMFGTSIIFTPVAACIAATVVSLPLMYQNCKSAFMGVDENLENAARTLGATEWKVFLKVTVPLALPGILSGIVLSFARAIGEFGATLMIAGNIPGKTQTIPTAIYYAVEAGDTHKANILMGIVLTFSFIVIFALNKWMKTRRIK